MSEQYVVYCSDRGTHRRIEFSPVVRDGEILRERPLRKPPAPWGKNASITADGETQPAPPFISVTKSYRDDFEGRERWQWVCPVCRRDVQMTGERLRLWLDAVDAHPSISNLDISLVP